MTPTSIDVASPTTESMAKVFQHFAKLISEQAALNANRKALDSVLRTRKAEYEKSMPKHAEFPSVPELQKKYRDRDLKQRGELDAACKENDKQVAETSHSIARHLLGALPSLEHTAQSHQQVEPQPKESAINLEEFKDTIDRGWQEKLKEQEKAFTLQLSSIKDELNESLKSDLRSEITTRQKSQDDRA